MKFTLATVGLLASSVAAVQFDNSNYDVVQGQPIVLKWSGASGPVTITLKNGPNSNLGTVTTIDSADSGSSFSWTPPPELASGTYAFQITDSTGTPNYSPQFTYSGNPSGTLGLTGVTSGASMTGTATTSASASATPTVTSTGSSASSASSASSTSGSATTTATTASSSSSKSASTTSSSSSSSASASATKPINGNDGQRISSSPLAIILATIAGLIYFN